MKKLLVLVIFLLAAGFAAAATTVLDDIDIGSLATWNIYDSGYNPAFTYQEITSPYDGGTAFKTSVSGNTIMYCDTKYIYKTFDVGLQNTQDSDLEAYLEFWYDGTYYNFPFVQVNLLDANDNIVGYHLWYGKNILTGHYAGIVANDLAHYTELPSDKGLFTLDLQDAGNNIEYSKIGFYVFDYTCEGNNYIILDKISLKTSSTTPPTDVPEFGIIAGAVALIGTLAIFAFKRK